MKTKKFLFYGLAALLAGCVPVVSLQPLFTKGDILFEEKLLGTWVEDFNDPEMTWEFTRLGESTASDLLEPWQDELGKFYRLGVADKEGHKGSLVACLVKLGDRTFLDIFPDQLPAGEQEIEKAKLVYNAFFFLPVHTFVRVDSIGDRLTMRLTDDDRFEELLQAEPAAVKHEMLADRPVLTASTSELQTFVTKYAGDERLFANELVLSRKNK
jgi:hypothetical protein